MALAYFISGTGDTDLAIAAINETKKKNPAEKIFLVPISSAAINQTAHLTDDSTVTRILLAELLNNGSAILPTILTSKDLKQVNRFLTAENIEHIYLGVASTDNEIPFQIALHCNIPHTIIYEYMFKPQLHTLWKYAERLTANENCRFAVTLNSAADDIRHFNPSVIIHEIGHLSIDRALVNKPDIDEQTVKKTLQVSPHEELVFIAGSTQTISVDNNFLDALLSELTTGNHPDLQLRFGIHPGVFDIDDYLQTLIATCENYPQAQHQFKIIVTKQIRDQLAMTMESGFLLPVEVSGPMAAQVATKIAQAVPGALLNEAALQGKPSYYYDKSVKPYLPAYWFTTDIAIFLDQQSQQVRTREALGLMDVTAPVALASLPASEFS